MHRRKLTAGLVVSLVGVLIGAGLVVADGVGVPATGSGLGVRPVTNDPSGNRWIAAERYTARFDGSGAEITSLDPSTGTNGPSVWLQLNAIRVGSTAVASGGRAGTVSGDGLRVDYGRGAIVERFSADQRGIEQSFVLAQRPASGDFVATVELASNEALGTSVMRSDGLLIPLGAGPWRLHVGAVTAVDAAGATARGSLSLAGGALTVTLAGAWLEQASYPVIVDPGFWIDFTSAVSERPAVAFDPGKTLPTPADEPRYLVVWQDRRSEDGSWAIVGRYFAKDGTPFGPAPFCVSRVGGTPICAAGGGYDDTNPTIAFKYGPAGGINCSSTREYLVAWERAHQGYPTLISYQIFDGRDPTGVAFSGIKNVLPPTGWINPKAPSASASPRGMYTGFAVSCNLSACVDGGCDKFVVSYFVEKSGTFEKGIAKFLVYPNDAATFMNEVVENLGTSSDPNAWFYPSVHYGNTTTSDYHVLAYRKTNGDIVYRKISAAGTTITPAIGSAAWIANSGGSKGPAVVAYSKGSDKWGFAWRRYYNDFGTWQTQVFSQLHSDTTSTTAFGSPLASQSIYSIIGQNVSWLPDYAIRGSHTVNGSGNGVFTIAFAKTPNTPANLDIFYKNFMTNNTLGPLVTIGNQTYEERDVKLAVTRRDPDVNLPATCNGSASNRCAVFGWSSYYLNGSDHDIGGWSELSLY